MIAVGGAVWAALMPMWDSNDNQSNKYWVSFEEPENYTSEVLFKFDILSNKGYKIRNILEDQFNKPSEFIRDFTPLYELIESNNSLTLRMIKAPYKLHHDQIIELLSNNDILPGVDYKLTWVFGSWNRKTKEFNL